MSFEQFGLDPCGNDPEPHQRANCAANGVPGGAYVQDGWGAIEVSGGNPELEPETGHTLGAGLVYTPLWAEGLSASVDYFQANRSNHISVSYPEEIMFECAERGASSMCEAITRLPDGYVTQVATYYRNFGETEVRAYDFAINWSAMTRIGELGSSLLATYLDRWDKQPFPGGETYSYAGNFDAAGARPRWRASGHLDWHSGPWMASYAGRIYRQLLGTRRTVADVSTSNSSLLIAASIRSCITTSKRDTGSTQASRCGRRSPMSLTKTRPTSTSRPPTRMWQPIGCWVAATFWNCVTRSSSRWSRATRRSARVASAAAYREFERATRPGPDYALLMSFLLWDASRGRDAPSPVQPAFVSRSVTVMATSLRPDSRC